MSSPPEWAASPPPVLAGPALLERAVGYTRASLQLVAGTPLDSRTPCERWDLLALLRHMNDALAAFTDAAEIGYVDLVPVRGSDPGAELVDRLRGRACALLAAWAHHPGTGVRRRPTGAGGAGRGAARGAAGGRRRPPPARPVRRAGRRTGARAAEHPAAGGHRPSRGTLRAS